MTETPEFQDYRRRLRLFGLPLRLLGLALILIGAGLLIASRVGQTVDANLRFGGFALLGLGWGVWGYVIWARTRWAKVNRPPQQP